MLNIPLNVIEQIATKKTQIFNIYIIKLKNSKFHFPTANPEGSISFTTANIEKNKYIKFQNNSSTFMCKYYNVKFNDGIETGSFSIFDNINIFKNITGQEYNNDYSGEIEIYEFSATDLEVSSTNTSEYIFKANSFIRKKGKFIITGFSTEKNSITLELKEYIYFKMQTLIPQRSYSKICDNNFGDENCLYNESGETTMQNGNISPRNGAFKTLVTYEHQLPESSNIIVIKKTDLSNNVERGMQWFDNDDNYFFIEEYFNSFLEHPVTGEKIMIKGGDGGALKDDNIYSNNELTYNQYIELLRPFSEPVPENSNIKMVFGCNRSKYECKNNYNNTIHFTGYSDI